MDKDFQAEMLEHWHHTYRGQLNELHAKLEQARWAALAFAAATLIGWTLYLLCLLRH